MDLFADLCQYESLTSERLFYEMQTNYKINKSTIMKTENTLNEETVTSHGSELNNNEENYLQKNLDYIGNQIKYLGFGEGFNEPLKVAMQSGNDRIDFPISKEFSSITEKEVPIDYTLHFNKGKESNMYFLNSYSAQLNLPDLTPENKHPQTFYLNKGKGFTAKEAFNLLSNRAVNKDLTNKEGETYNAWVQLKPAENNGEKKNRDFQIFNENYGYDLKAALLKIPIKEMETPEAEARLMNSLKKGNLQSVTFSDVDGGSKNILKRFLNTKTSTFIMKKEKSNSFLTKGQKAKMKQSLSWQTNWLWKKTNLQESNDNF